MTVHTFDGYDAEAWLQLHWTEEDRDAAKKEGWAIWQGGSDMPPYTIESFDFEDVSANPWLKVRTGTGAHHTKARAFVAHYSSDEWKQINDWYDKTYGRS